MALSGYQIGGFTPQSTSIGILPVGSQPGKCSDPFPGRVVLPNSNRVADVWTFTLSYTASTDYIFYINGLPMALTSDATTGDAGDDLAALKAAFIAVVNESTLSGTVLATAGGAGVFIVTSRQPGVALTVYEADALIASVHTTSASNSSAVEVGKIVCRSADGLGFALPSPNAVAAVAQVTTATLSAVSNAGIYTGIITMLGGAFEGNSYPFQALGDGDASMAEVITALGVDANEKLPVLSVLVTEDDVTLTFTSEVAGVPFHVALTSTVAAQNTTVTTTVVNVSEVDGLDLSLVGPLEYEANLPQAMINPDNAANVIVDCQEIFLKPENAPSAMGAAIYLRHTVGADTVNQTPGTLRFDDSDSGGCVLLSSSTIALNRLRAEIGSNTYSFRIPRPLELA